jgi:hypothetical protein
VYSGGFQKDMLSKVHGDVTVRDSQLLPYSFHFVWFCTERMLFL